MIYTANAYKLAIILAFFTQVVSPNLAFSDTKSRYSWTEWCQQSNKDFTRSEIYLVNLISIQLSKQFDPRSCEDEQRIIEKRLATLTLSGRGIEDLSPLMVLRNSKKIESLDLVSTRLNQREINKLKFLDSLPSFKRLRLPKVSEGQPRILCPFRINAKCW